MYSVKAAFFAVKASSTKRVFMNEPYMIATAIICKDSFCKTNSDCPFLNIVVISKFEE